ncbi:MAG: serine hydrolase [Fuerstiella sp.]|nr:serine hydrolase [Fuerstiella sp.]
MRIHVQAVTRWCLIFGLALSALRGAHADDALSSQVDALFAEYDRADAPGCAIGIVSQGKLIFSKGFGSANLDHEVANTPQTVFEIGSFAKSFTCACMAILLDQGKISPDDDLRRYVPEMHEFEPPVRIRHMIHCRSGILLSWPNGTPNPRKRPVRRMTC